MQAYFIMWVAGIQVLESSHIVSQDVPPVGSEVETGLEPGSPAWKVGVSISSLPSVPDVHELPVF